MQTPEVSVVVCTFNRAAMLHEALTSLLTLRTGGRFRYEVLVVDNGSTDDTPEVVRRLAAEADVPVRRIEEPAPGVAAARNRGIVEAHGAWIAFFDDDQLADPDWLAELLALAERTGACCVGGAVDLRLPPGVNRRLAAVCRRVLGATGEEKSACRYTRKRMPGTGNVMIHRTVFDTVGLFDPALAEAGEDVDLFRRIRAAGIPSWFTPSAIVYHVIPPYRLRDDYLRWVCIRVGACFAHRDRLEKGRWGLQLRLTARLAQAMLIHTPRLFWQRLRRTEEEALGTRCLLWRLLGYARYALRALMPRLCVQRAFFSRIDFRWERGNLVSETPR